MLSPKLYTYIAYFSSLTIAFPLFIGWLRFKSFPWRLRVFCMYVSIIAITEGVTSVMSHFTMGNHWIMNIYTIVEFIVVSYIYYISFESSLLKRLMLFSGSIYLAYTTIFFIQTESFYILSSYPMALKCVIFMVYAILLFYRALQRLPVYQIEREPFFWINSGILLYSAGNLFLFTFYTYLLENNLYTRELWLIHSILNVLLNLSFAIGLLCKPKKWMTSPI